MREDFAERARALVGTRFRPQGRSPETGVDCVGFVLATFGIEPTVVRRDYRFRGDHRAEVERELGRFFRRVPPTRQRTGDLMLLAVSDDQLHFAVRADTGFVHAHARIGRVVETPGAPQWPILGFFRKRLRPNEGS